MRINAICSIHGIVYPWDISCEQHKDGGYGISGTCGKCGQKCTFEEIKERRTEGK